MAITETECEFYEDCIENNSDGCCECDIYTSKSSVENAINFMNDNPDDAILIMLHQKEALNTLVNHMIYLKNEYGLKVTLSELLTIDIVERFKVIANTEILIKDYETELNSSKKEFLIKTVEECSEIISTLCDIDNDNGGSLGFLLSHFIKGEDVNIGMIGISESKHLITYDIDSYELCVIENPYPVKRE